MKKNDFFVNAILPGYDQIRPNSPIQSEDVTPEITSASTIDFGIENQEVLVLSESGISEQSTEMLKKIFSAMKIPEDRILYYFSSRTDLDKNTLLLGLHKNLKCRIIFLIGATINQSIFGKDFKISQNQGQIFPEKLNQDTFYLIPLYHPDFIALNHSIKNLTWASVKKLIPWAKQQLSLH